MWPLFLFVAVCTAVGCVCLFPVVVGWSCFGWWICSEEPHTYADRLDQYTWGKARAYMSRAVCAVVFSFGGFVIGSVAAYRGNGKDWQSALSALAMSAVPCLVAERMARYEACKDLSLDLFECDALEVFVLAAFKRTPRAPSSQAGSSGGDTVRDNLLDGALRSNATTTNPTPLPHGHDN